MPLQHLPPNVFLIGAIVLLALVGFLLVAKPPRPASPYRRKPLLSAWERKALPLLIRQLPPGFHLCAQVRLADMLVITVRDPRARQVALNRVASKSVDFVVVDAASGEAVLVIELDDRSHARPDRQARDAFVNNVLHDAGIPIVRFMPSQRIDIRPLVSAA